MNTCSVIIPCYNYGQYLGECIESCLAQTVLVEIIVVDDCSTDNTKEIAAKYTISYIKNSVNLGLPISRNIGIKAAKGQRILCLDADDTIEPTMIEKCLNVEDVAIVGVHNFGDFEDWVLPYEDLSLEAFKIQNRITCCSMFNKSDWEAVGGFDESMKDGKEDYDFFLSLLKIGVKFTAVNECLFNYRMKPNRMSLSADSKEKEILEYIHKKHKDIWTN